MRTFRIKLSLLSLIVVVVTGLSLAPSARGGLTLNFYLYRADQGSLYAFYTPLSTNAVGSAPALGTYAVISPNWPTNGSIRTFSLTVTGMTDVYSGDSEFAYDDFASAMQEMTNGNWRLVFTNAVATNTYSFKVSTSMTSNQLPATVISFPLDGSFILSDQTNLTWQGPSSWSGSGNAYVSGSSYYFSSAVSPSQTSLAVNGPLPVGNNYFCGVQYVTNYATSLFTSTTPSNIVTSALLSGWVVTSTLESSSSASFSVFTPPPPSLGHTNVAWYTFENHTLVTLDFSGHGNNFSGYSTYFGSNSVYITNNAAAGSYAMAFPGGSWLDGAPPILVTNLAGSFSVSARIKVKSIQGNDNDDQYSAVGIVSAFSGDYNTSVMPLGMTGSKLAFYTGGDFQNVLYSHASISAGGPYVHVVATRDRRTGEKKIYINGVLDASVYSSTNLLDGSDPNGLSIGYNNGYAFNGQMDDIQIYTGVLSANEVAMLYANPGTNAPDTTGVVPSAVIAHYDFDEGTAIAPDVSGHGNDIVQAGNFGGNGPAITNDTIAGAGSIRFDGGSYLAAPASLLPALAGSFSVSVWVKTTQNFSGIGFNAAGIVAADVPGIANDLIPVGMDSDGAIVFNTGNTDGNYDDTLTTSGTVNDGVWHHIVVTRNQATGEKRIYLDDSLDTFDFDTLKSLNSPSLLTIGALADASQSNPSLGDYYNGFDGLIDDVQIYSSVLAQTNVDYLYNNPGQAIAGLLATVPLQVNLSMQIFRDESGFNAYPNISISPPPVTTNEVDSPNGQFVGWQGGPYSASSVGKTNLGGVLSECTNGLWTLIVNKGDPTEQRFSFTVSATAVDPNLLGLTTILSPTNNSTGVAPNAALTWSGPAALGYLVAEIFAPLPANNRATNLPPASTSWTPPPTLTPGTNTLQVLYTSNNYPNIAFTLPLNSSQQSPSDWSASVALISVGHSVFVVSGSAALPAQLLNVQRSGGNLQFSFTPQTGHTNIIEATTNLAVGQWTALSNFVGDGTLHQFTFEATNPPIRFFRVRTQ
jgi:hypothetical protein